MAERFVLIRESWHGGRMRTESDPAWQKTGIERGEFAERFFPPKSPKGETSREQSVRFSGASFHTLRIDPPGTQVEASPRCSQSCTPRPHAHDRTAPGRV